MLIAIQKRVVEIRNLNEQILTSSGMPSRPISFFPIIETESFSDPIGVAEGFSVHTFGVTEWQSVRGNQIVPSDFRS